MFIFSIPLLLIKYCHIPQKWNNEIKIYWQKLNYKTNRLIALLFIHLCCFCISKSCCTNSMEARERGWNSFLISHQWTEAYNSIWNSLTKKETEIHIKDILWTWLTTVLKRASQLFNSIVCLFLVYLLLPSQEYLYLWA